ncbi:universal stress protein [Tengunoibacter tsumagoiensis]|uniref:Universal stress protein UspA n=1 Tax=Tengunoibacter tsumagoiensis TaxID=2014871 RepID=A0A401ZX34_9CHLR|nr:universal stress protein [Tengunoibacter tsumagoiensis]GCE11390.1 universal stress protein UspA [Tengunoibacter tsumagoiensis]
MFKQIIVPLDGSLAAEQAVPLAARIALASLGRLKLVHVVTVSPEQKLLLGAKKQQQRHEEELQKANDYLTGVIERHPLTAVEVEHKVLFGQPGSTLLKYINEQQSALVVLIAFEEPELKRWIFGSVAQELVRNSTIPMLILREKGKELEPDAKPPRALVCLDGSELAETVLEPAAYLLRNLALSTQKEFHLIRMVLKPTEREEAANLQIGISVRRQAWSEAEEYLRAVSKRVAENHPELQVTWAVQESISVAKDLIKLAMLGEETSEPGVYAEAYDLIALTTVGRQGLDRHILGSVAERILHDATVPLFVVPPPVQS